MFENSKWIWINNESNKDESAEFFVDFFTTKKQGIIMDIGFYGLRKFGRFIKRLFIWIPILWKQEDWVRRAFTST